MKPITLLSIGMASDHAGFDLKIKLKAYLETQGVGVYDYGTHSSESTDYADYAHPLALAIEGGACDFGIALCGSGNGINMTLNKHQGIRAALCWNSEVSALARLHNNANILTLPARFISEDEAIAILKAFFETDFEGGRHQARIDKIPYYL